MDVLMQLSLIVETCLKIEIEIAVEIPEDSFRWLIKNGIHFGLNQVFSIIK